MIKKQKIKDEEKLEIVQKEFTMLDEILRDLKLESVQPLLEEMVEVNLKLWEIEDLIREKERDKAFDEEFIDLARKVYYTNDQRFAVKDKINAQYGSDIREVKSYEDYE